MSVNIISQFHLAKHQQQFLSCGLIIKQHDTQVNPLAPAPCLFQDYIGLHLLTLYAEVFASVGPLKQMLPSNNLNET